MRIIQTVGLVLLISCSFVFASTNDAIDSLQAEITKDPNNYKLHYDLGMCYNALAEYAEAINAFARVLELNPDFTQAQYRMAIVYYELDSLEKACEHFETMKNNYQSDSLGMLLQWLGTTYTALGEYEKVIELYSDYDKRKNRKMRYAAVAAIAGAMMGKYLESIEGFKMALRYWKDYYDYEKNIALLY